MNNNVGVEECFINAEQPWPGLAAFTETAQGYFHGRSQATAELVSLVGTSTASVLFGQSGLGKTSLIQAGLFPQLRSMGFLPVYVRLDHAETVPPLATQILDALLAECHRLNVDAPERIQAEHGPENSLWAYFHRQNADFWADGIELLTPVLVLDQVEEIFTLGRQSRETEARSAAFIEDLAGLVENRPPLVIRQMIDADPTKARQYDFTRASFRLLISLREDFLPELEGLMQQLPTLRLNRMRLKPMNGLEALQVAEEGGGTLVEPGVGERIVRFVAADTKGRSLSELAVEPSLLSLMCRELNIHRQEQGLPQINASLLTGAHDEILDDFYNRCLADQTPELGRFIEEHLLTESGYRQDKILEDALQLPGVSRAAIDTLIQRRLLRLEERSGLWRVELTHDVLTRVAKERRASRREIERQAEMDRQLRAQRRKTWIFGASAVVMLLGALVVYFQEQRVRRITETIANISPRMETAANATETPLAIRSALKYTVNQLQQVTGGNKLKYSIFSAEGMVENSDGFSINGTPFKVARRYMELYPDLMQLIALTESMDNKDKQFWLDKMPGMTGKQIDKLFEILATERKKLYEIGKQFDDEVKMLVRKHVRENIIPQLMKGGPLSPGEAKEAMDVIFEDYREKVLSEQTVRDYLRRIELKLEAAATHEADAYDQYGHVMGKQVEFTKDYQQKLEFDRRSLRVRELALAGGIASSWEVSGNQLNISWYLLMVGNPAEAERVCLEALRKFPSHLALETNLAHARALQGRREQAIEIYLRNRGKPVISSSSRKTWDKVILDDFEQLQKAGIKHQVFDEVREILKTKKSTTAESAKN